MRVNSTIGLCVTIGLEHVEQGGLTGIIKAEEDYICIFLEEALVKLSSWILMPLPWRSVPKVRALKASSGTSALSLRTLAKAFSRSNGKSSCDGCGANFKVGSSKCRSPLGRPRRGLITAHGHNQNDGQQRDECEQLPDLDPDIERNDVGDETVP